MKFLQLKTDIKMKFLQLKADIITVKFFQYMYIKLTNNNL